MKVPEAIEVLKRHNDNKRGHPVEIPDIRVLVEAIDTVVKALEKPTYTTEDMEAFAKWLSLKEYSYHPKAKIWTYGMPNRKTTTQLREMWEQERRIK